MAIVAAPPTPTPTPTPPATPNPTAPTDDDDNATPAESTESPGRPYTTIPLPHLPKLICGWNCGRWLDDDAGC